MAEIISQLQQWPAATPGVTPDGGQTMKSPQETLSCKDQEVTWEASDSDGEEQS